MPIEFEDISNEDKWAGSDWSVTDTDDLAHHIARVTLGQYRHVAKVLAATGASALRPHETAFTGARTLLTSTQRDPWHRDGWIFQTISWIADFEPELSTRMAALDGLENVIRIGSFSKTLSASVRCGYISARPDWIEALIYLQVATNFGGPSPMASELVYFILSSGSYRKHMEALRVRLDQTRTEVATNLERLGLEITVRPRGGFYLWCKLPGHQDSAALAKSALIEDVVLAPGNVFSPSLSKDNYMRFNVSHTDKKAMDVIAAAIS